MRFFGNNIYLCYELGTDFIVKFYFYMLLLSRTPL